MPAEIRGSFPEVCILRRVKEDPRTSVQKIVAAEDVSVSLVCRILHE
jgi:hypothetical protein